MYNELDLPLNIFFNWPKVLWICSLTTLIYHLNMSFIGRTIYAIRINRKIKIIPVLQNPKIIRQKAFRSDDFGQWVLYDLMCHRFVDYGWSWSSTHSLYSSFSFCSQGTHDQSTQINWLCIIHSVHVWVGSSYRTTHYWISSFASNTTMVNYFCS